MLSLQTLLAQVIRSTTEGKFFLNILSLYPAKLELGQKTLLSDEQIKKKITNFHHNGIYIIVSRFLCSDGLLLCPL